MRHKSKGKKFNRTRTERDSLYRNLIQSLFIHERIITTEKKAKAIRPVAEKLITYAKKQDLSARRKVSGYIYIEDVAHKLYHDIALRFKDRAGGYLRIFHLGPRQSDGTKMAIIELVEKATKKTIEKSADTKKEIKKKDDKDKKKPKKEKKESKKKEQKK